MNSVTVVGSFVRRVQSDMNQKARRKRIGRIKRHTNKRPGLDVQPVHRSVISNKLLAALTDNSGKVAIVVNQDELQFLIDCVSRAKFSCTLMKWSDERGDVFLKGMEALRDSAFPQPRGDGPP